MSLREPSSWPLPVATGCVLLGFAANSLLCRAALGSGQADAASFSALRLVSGALTLLLFLRPRDGGLLEDFRAARALALAAYVLAFSFAYRSLGAGTGSLLLFGAVQVTLLVLSLRYGEAFPPRRWIGVLLACAGLGILCAPSAQRPSLLPALSMLAAGLAWGVYTWLGRGAVRPLRETCGAFLGASVVALLLLLLPAHHALTTRGAVEAILSGSLASGATYALWYTVVPRLGGVRAAVVQLSVPVLTAGMAALWLGEWPTPSWFLATALTLGGILLVSR